jgi:hypothetical protein
VIDVVWGGVFFIHILLRLGVYAYNQNFTLIENISGTDILSPLTCSPKTDPVVMLV